MKLRLEAVKPDYSNVEELALKFGWKEHFEKIAKSLAPSLV